MTGYLTNDANLARLDDLHRRAATHRSARTVTSRRLRLRPRSTERAA